MKKLILSALSASSLFVGSADALTVIDQNGRAQQLGESNQQQNNQKKAPTRMDYYDAWGRHEGYSRKGFGNRTDHYDSWGRQEGYSRRSFSGDVEHYDSQGRSLGTTKER
jgi:hypothetical protein